jgi:hypothetical protein
MPSQLQPSLRQLPPPRRCAACLSLPPPSPYPSRGAQAAVGAVARPAKLPALQAAEQARKKEEQVLQDRRQKREELERQREAARREAMAKQAPAQPAAAKESGDAAGASGAAAGASGDAAALPRLKQMIEVRQLLTRTSVASAPHTAAAFLAGPREAGGDAAAKPGAVRHRRSGEAAGS